MFDIGASELLVVVVVAILVIGPKDMPRAMRTAGRCIGKVRRVSAHFRSGIDTMIREAEMEDMEKEWRERNAAIMRGETPASAEAGLRPPPASPDAPRRPDRDPAMEPLDPDAAAEAARQRAKPATAPPPPVSSSAPSSSLAKRGRASDDASDDAPAPPGHDGD